MTDDSGLQIDIRCINCGSFPAANNPLFEMQNHRYICNTCRHLAEQRGKLISWANGAQPQMATSGTRTGTGPVVGIRAAGMHKTASLPPDSLFATLNLSLSTSPEEIRNAIKQRMKMLLREEETPQRTKSIERLHEWQELADDPQKLRDYAQMLQPARQTLSVGGKLVYSAEEFVAACEASRDGWADGERYLRNGELAHWVLYQLENSHLSKQITLYQRLQSISDFRALNEALYCLVPGRPFRLYQDDAWQSATTVPSASTPQELARLCDLHWKLGERHLYAGSLGFWLEQSWHIQGLKQYYDAAVVGYAQAGEDRGVGLELLLERALPELPRPQLLVTFDGIEGKWETPGNKRWDREIPHQPITVKVTNTTRGFTSIDLKLEPPQRSSSVETEWLALDYSSSSIAGRPGHSMPTTRKIRFLDLSKLKRGHTYKRNLVISRKQEYGKPPVVQNYPITLKTMRFFDGLRGVFWCFGLRGELPGLFWNFAAGLLLAFISFLLITGFIHESFITQTQNAIASQDMLSLANILQALIAGLAYSVKLQFYGIGFPLAAGIISALLGLCVGFRRGHADYTEQEGTATFRKWASWSALIFTLLLIAWGPAWQSLTAAFQIASYQATLFTFFFLGGSILVGILLFVITCIVGYIRYRLEKYLRVQYKELLNLPGRA